MASSYHHPRSVSLRGGLVAEKKPPKQNSEAIKEFNITVKLSSGEMGAESLYNMALIVYRQNKLEEAENYIFKMNDTLTELSGNLEKHSNLVEAVKKVVSENTDMSKQMATFKKNAIEAAMEGFKENVEKIGDINFLSAIMPLGDADILRHAAFKLKGEIENLFLVMGSAENQKAILVVMISDNLVSEKGLNASNIIREIAKEIQGGGGGQPFFATAGGKNPKGIASAIVKAKEIVQGI